MLLSTSGWVCYDQMGHRHFLSHICCVSIQTPLSAACRRSTPGSVSQASLFSLPGSEKDEHVLAMLMLSSVLNFSTFLGIYAHPDCQFVNSHWNETWVSVDFLLKMLYQWWARLDSLWKHTKETTVDWTALRDLNLGVPPGIWTYNYLSRELHISPSKWLVFLFLCRYQNH